MRISMVYFLFPFLIQSFSYCYIPQRNSIEVFARKPHKNNLPLGTHSSRIQLPYTRPRHYQTKHANFNSHTEKPLFQEQYYQQVCQYIETNFQQKYHEFKYYCEHEYGEHNDGHYAVLNRNHRIEKRFGALQDIESIGAHYALYNYVLPQDVINYLKTVGHNADSYTFCYGNQVQHSIHEDCIMLLQETSMIPVSSIMHSRVSAIIDCIDAARIYNQAADCLKACTVQDFCWSLLEYGKAVAEGVVWGAVGAVHDCLQHPLHTAACVIIPEGVLVYQLSKVLVNVADISVTYLFDKEKGRRKLHDYSAPLTQIINALQNRELSGPEIVRGATQLAIHWRAQNKLLSGLSKFYTTSKIKLEQFVKENSFAVPELYMTAPEGFLLKCAIKGSNSSNNPTKILKKYSRKYWIKKHQLPTKGKIRYVPPKNFHLSEGLPRKRLANGDVGFVDRFENVWVIGESRTKGEPFEWDVQLSN